ncbi:MAG: hypothetical protein JO264_15505 [Acidisphaera sp.]|nr:hypothetical protein [Acidisphaera sp.]
MDQVHGTGLAQPGSAGEGLCLLSSRGPRQGPSSLPTYGGLYAWEFERGRRELKVRVEGQLVFNSIACILKAVLAGFGLAYLPRDLVATHLADGALIQVLAEWCPPFPGYHLYYPSRRQPTPAFALLVDALRYRGERSR